jgi:TatD DNase family protein
MDESGDGHPQWADAHNHLHDPRLRGRQSPPWPAVVNATCEADWDDVASLAAAHPSFIRPAFGIHPWHAGAVAPGWETRLRKQLESHPTAGLGECGLDGTRRGASPDVQREVFLAQLRHAVDFDRFLVVHCVRAWAPLIDALDRQPPPPRWMVHSFSGSAEIAARLIGMGAYLSLSAAALDPRRGKLRDAIRAIPEERILVETDAPHQPPPGCGEINAPANLPAIGEALAGVLGRTPAAFAGLTRGNLLRMLGENPPLP